METFRKGNDRRKHERVTKSLPVGVRLDRSGPRYEGELVNIGAGGVLLKTELTVVTNDLITIELNIEGEREPIAVYGTVVRSDPRGVGVSFVRISEITSDLIAYLVRKWQRGASRAM